MAPGCTVGKRTEDPFWPFMLLLNSLFLWQYIPSTVQHLYSYGQAKCGARGKGCLMAKQSAWNVPPLACLLALPLSHALLSSFQEWTGVCTGTLTGPWLCSPILSKPFINFFSSVLLQWFFCGFGHLGLASPLHAHHWALGAHDPDAGWLLSNTLLAALWILFQWFDNFTFIFSLIVCCNCD